MDCWKFACEEALERFTYLPLGPVPRFWALYFQLAHMYPLTCDTPSVQIYTSRDLMYLLELTEYCDMHSIAFRDVSISLPPLE